MLPAGLVLLAGVLGAAWWRIRSRQKAQGMPADSSFLESRLQPDSFFGASGGQNVDTAEQGSPAASSMMYSPSQLDAGGDVDPVAEADVYLAYGRDLQAEEILKEALRTDPQRIAIHCKLLDIYARRSDEKAFEVLAYEVYSMTKGMGPEWDGVCELGRELSPHNPLYQPGGIASGAGNASFGMQATQPQMLQSFSALATTRIDSTDETSDAPDVDLDFLLDDDPPTQAVASATPTAPEVEFSSTAADTSDNGLAFDDFSPPPPLPPVPPLPAGEKNSAYRVNQVDEHALEFEDFSAPAPAADFQPPAYPQSPPLDDNALAFDDFSAPPPLPPVPPLTAGEKNSAHRVNQVQPSPNAAPDDQGLEFDMNALAFDLDESAPPAPPAASQSAAASASSASSNDFSFDMLEFDMGDLSHSPSAASLSASQGFVGGAPTGPGDLLDMDMIGSEVVGSDEGDPLETKLSLAAEFLAIGDADAARSLAEEVLNEASGELKKKANKFLTDIA